MAMHSHLKGLRDYHPITVVYQLFVTGFAKTVPKGTRGEIQITAIK